MEIQKRGQIPKSNVTEYEAKDGLIRFYISNKGESGQFFYLTVPNSLSYEEALEQFSRHVPQLEAPEIDDSIVASIMANIGVLRKQYALGVDFKEIFADMKKCEQYAIQASEAFSKSFSPKFPKLGEKGIKYRLGIFLPKKLIEVAGASEMHHTPPYFCIESGEKAFPSYLLGLMQKFKSGISEQELTSVFTEFEKELAY